MIPGARRPLSLLLLPLLLICISCGAEKKDTGPEATVKRLIQAAKRQNSEAVYELLGPRTRKRLKEHAARAGRQSGAEKRFAPHEMLSPSFRWSLEGDWKPKRFETVFKTSRTARVRVVGEKPTQKQVVTLARVKGSWRVELPDPDKEDAPTGK